MEPVAGSMMRNRAGVRKDLLAPVRPTIPTCGQEGEGESSGGEKEFE